ncbi:aromatic ring-hydroxylating dioxygenase subunit alpha [Thalassotalea euphylliae]|uniref:aromatic ring-hydroxylating oxygenase subunit alpha n=1 Tax=Thalassotalea euphylliae TaxID=1655234 RepID=UPI0036374D72
MNQILPVESYTSTDYFALEQTHIFTQSWTFAGLTEDLSASGDYLTVQAGLANIVVLKNEDGALVAYHNRCRHRGMQLVDGKGSGVKRLTCPYHDWSYGIDGTLKSLPKQKQEFRQIDKSCYSLQKAAVGTWRGMIWVNPNIDAEPVQQWFSPMNQHIAPYNVDDLVEATSDRENFIIHANWKLVVENYIDHYHLAQLHSGTLNMYAHNKASFGFAERHFHFWEPLTDEYRDNLSQFSPLPLLMSQEDEKLGAYVPMLFPAIGLVESESTWTVFNVIPEAPDRTRVETRTKVKNCSTIRYVSQAAKSYSFWQQRTRQKDRKLDKSHPLGSADFMQEDIYVCESIQKAMRSPYFSTGPTAEYGESPIRQFRQQIHQIIKERQ